MYIDAGQILGATVQLWTSNLSCFSISIDDILLDYGRVSSTRFDFGVDIRGLGISCALNYRYKWSFMSGSGAGQIYSSNNSASTTIQFASNNFDESPPSGSSVSECVADIQIDDMDFQGGIVASILDTFEKSLRGTVENELKSTACDELGSLGTTLVSDMLDVVYDLLDNYLGSLPVGYNDILNAEKSLVIPTGVDLVDFSNIGDDLIGGNVGDLFQRALQLADDALGTYTPDTNSPTGTGQDLGINKLLRDFVLDPDRSFTVDIDDFPGGFFNNGIIFQGSDLLTETVIKMKQIKLFGLDTFNSFDPLNGVGKYTLSNSFYWRDLTVAIMLDLSMKPSTNSNSVIAVGNGEVSESIEIDFKLNDIDVDFSFLLGVDEDLLGKLQLGQVIQVDQILPCVMKALHEAEITGFSVNVSDVETPSLGGFISPGIDRIISNAADAVFLMYEPTFNKAIPNIFQITIRNTLNDAIRSLMEESKSGTSCPVYEAFPSPEQSFINLQQLITGTSTERSSTRSLSNGYGSIIGKLFSYARDEIKAFNPTTQELYINELIGAFTKDISNVTGALLISDNILDLSSRIDIGELKADLDLQISGLEIENLNSIGLPLSILDPTSEITVNNVITIGANDKPLKGNIDVVIGFENGADLSLRNAVSISLALKDTVVDLTVLIAALESSFMKFPLEDMDNIDCWLALMPAPTVDEYGIRLSDSILSLALHDLGIDIGELKLDIDCIECTSPKFIELASIISSPEVVEDLTDIVNKGIAYITDLLGGPFLQSYLDQTLVTSSRRCPHSPDFEALDSPRVEYAQFEAISTPASSITYMIVVGSIIASIGLISALIFFVVKVIRSRRRKAWLAKLSKKKMRRYLLRQEEEDLQMKELNEGTRSMFKSSSIPLVVRIMVPIVILINIGLFLSGHISLGASVDINAQIGGESFKVKEVFVFSMAESIMDMWEAGAKELAILIIFFSGLWPYTKQFTVLFLWFAGPNLTSVSRRESILLWLDTLGKWSFVDIFVLVVSVASFRVQIESPSEVSFLPNDLYELQLLVVPCWGLYSNMIAQLVSQINSHIMIHYHRKIIYDYENRLLDTEDKSILHKHDFRREGKKGAFPIQIRKGMNSIILFISFMFIGLLSMGLVFPTFSLTQQGLVGLVVSFAGETKVYHNVLSIVQLLLNQAFYTKVITDYMGLGSLSAIFILTVIAIPLLQLGFLLKRWFKPLTERARLRNFVIVEALQAWQYLEVYIFSILIACWQLGNVSNFLINEYCGSFESTFKSLAYYGILLPEDAQCFRVNATVESATWLFIGASVLLLVLTHFIRSAAKQQDDDLLEAMEALPTVSRRMKSKSKSKMGSSKSKKDSFADEYTIDMIDAKLRPSPPRFSDFYRWCLTKSSKTDETTQ
jgi:hypothetical protein